MRCMWKCRLCPGFGAMCVGVWKGRGCQMRFVCSRNVMNTENLSLYAFPSRLAAHVKQQRVSSITPCSIFFFLQCVLKKNAKRPPPPVCNNDTPIGKWREGEREKREKERHTHTQTHTNTNTPWTKDPTSFFLGNNDDRNGTFLWQSPPCITRTKSLQHKPNQKSIQCYSTDITSVRPRW